MANIALVVSLLFQYLKTGIFEAGNQFVYSAISRIPIGFQVP